MMKQLHPDLFHTEARRISALIDAALNPEVPDLFMDIEDEERCERCGLPVAKFLIGEITGRRFCPVCHLYRNSEAWPEDWDEECAFCEATICPELENQAPRTLLVELDDGYLYTYVICSEVCDEGALDALYGPRYGPPVPEPVLDMSQAIGPWERPMGQVIGWMSFTLDGVEVNGLRVYGGHW